MWEDVQSVADAWIHAEESGLDPESASPSHFLGAVVLQQMPSKAGFVGRWGVIDGQQRLTTLQLMLDAIQSVMKEAASPDEAERLGMLILNNKLNTAAPDDRFKVWPTNADREAFRAVMDDATDASAYGSSRVLQAHEFFRAAVRDWAGSGHNAADRLRSLSHVLISKLELVVIDLESGDNPQVIFETLNARGTPLLAFDLVKNYLLRMPGLDQERVQAIYEGSLALFDRPEWRAPVLQGRFKRPRADVFLFHWLTLRLRRVTWVGQEFTDLRDYVDRDGLSADEVAADLRSIAERFAAIEDIPWNTREGRAHYRLGEFDVGSLTPLLMFLYGDATELSPPDRLRTLEMLESWVIRRALCGRPSASNARTAAELVDLLSPLPAADIVNVVSDWLHAQTAAESDWPDDVEVIAACVHRPVYTAMVRRRVRTVLEALEDDAHGNLTAAHVQQGKLTIEHVLPQQWTIETWPQESVADAAERRVLVHTLGNLTLVNGKLNAALSNGPWPTKRALLDEHNVLHLNKSLIKLDNWSDGAIAERSRSLRPARRGDLASAAEVPPAEAATVTRSGSSTTTTQPFGPTWPGRPVPRHRYPRSCLCGS